MLNHPLVCSFYKHISAFKSTMLLVLPLLMGYSVLSGQNQNAACNTSQQKFSATAFLNYGAVNAYNSTTTSSVTVGQTTTTSGLWSQNYRSEFGFWGKYLLPPLAPIVTASEGDLPDRIEVKWDIDKTGPGVTKTFKVYRNGTFLAEVGAEERVYVDYNVFAGEFYTYAVRGSNKAGIGKAGSSVGFLNPNGVITGRIQTPNGNPVKDCVVELTPSLGSALKFLGDDAAFAAYDTAWNTPHFTASFWVKQDSLNHSKGLLDFGSSINKNWWFHTPPSSQGRGIVVRMGGTADSIKYLFEPATATQWHHVAATFSGTNLLLYVDGALKGSMGASWQHDSIPLFFGAKTMNSGQFGGKLDEVIILNRQMTQTEIVRNLNRTISSRTEGLVGYWKMDEGSGSKAYDLTERHLRSYLCGPVWTSDKAPVTNSTTTDEAGYYIMEGINYGSGKTFTAKPSKKIYKDVSLEFNAADQKWAELADFDLPDISTINISFNPFDLTGIQTILSKEGHFRLFMNSGKLHLDIAGTDLLLDTMSLGWQNILIQMEQAATSLSIKYYRNGVLKKQEAYSGVANNWANLKKWTLGAYSTPTPTQYFTGLVDEVVFYEDTLSLSKIQTQHNLGTNPGEPKIVSLYLMNEAQGDSLYHIGTLGATGVVHNANWANAARKESTTPHEFLPSSKLVTLNKTNTSTDQVDFVDLSTISVSGYVRYNNTNCFADSVEILVNGYPASPPAYTDANGYFIVELEPGASAKLTPKYHGHSFIPAFYEVKNVVSPVAGVLFKDNTTRTVTGQLAGGHCKKSIIPAMGSATVKLSTLDQCYSKQIQVTAENGKFTFTNVPPFECTIGVTFHSDTEINDYFALRGGPTLNLTFENDTVDFIYYAPPKVKITQVGDTICNGITFLNQRQEYTVNISVVQEYFGNDPTCPVDTFNLEIINGFIQEAPPTQEFSVTNSSQTYTFRAGPPNTAAPYLKTLQISAEADGITNDTVIQAVVFGKKARNVNFASTTPSIPWMILHDPPGDQSYSKLEKDETYCASFSLGMNLSVSEMDEVEIDIGPDVELVTGLGVANINEIDVEAETTLKAELRHTAGIDASAEICHTLLESYTTNTEETIVGESSDFYMGGALNLLFGITDIVKLNGCQIVRDTGVHVVPGGFETNFFYSEYDINKTVIPNLLIIGDTISANIWQNIIALNNLNKANAPFKENISFGSGVSIERSEINTVSGAMTISFDVDLTLGVATELGLEYNGVGTKVTRELSMTIGLSSESTFSTSQQTEIGYKLGDNDPGDVFTVNIKKDPVFGTPVFQTVSGSSSCPYENQTVPRDEINLNVDQFVANNVPENAEAVFHFNLGNISQTGEFRTYLFSLRQSSNVNGAIVKINGSDPEQEFGIDPFKSVPVTVSVERGPTSYTDTLIFDFVSECEDDLNTLLGIPKENTPFTKSITVVVNFLESCSPIDISNPSQDWVQTPAEGVYRPITLVEFDVNDPDLDYVEVQYRRSQGDGAWTLIKTIDKDTLGPVFENLNWNTAGLADGLYEIRAVAFCVGGLDAGISHVIKGRIERTPPDLFGMTEPADGVLSRGDEISITFNEPVQCTEVFMAAGIGASINNYNLGLYNTETGELVDFTMSCSGDKIILVPKGNNFFIENKLLRVEVDSILDLAGNKSGHHEWEFVVDRNSVNWVDRQDVKVVKYEEDFVHQERRIENRGGQYIDYELRNLPAWCDVYPTAGQLAPGEVRIINFDFDQSMAFGKQLDTLILHSAEGDEPMILDARVICHQPDWEVKPRDYEYAMNFVLELNIEGDTSKDEEDLVAAFIDGQVRGLSYVQYYPALNKYLAFLTVYSNSIAASDINLKIWDASSCLLYNSVVENFVFESDDLIGTPIAAQMVHTNNLVLSELRVHPGWNWLSFNLVLDQPQPTSVLSGISNPLNAIIKSQTQFAQYAPLLGWFGSLNTIGNTSAYQLRVNDADTILIVGRPIDPDTLLIPIDIGWNWVGFIPNNPLPTNQALTSIGALNGDLIKSQTQFAQYVSGLGWIGTLEYLRPGEGYIIKTSVEDTLIYPNIVTALNAPEENPAGRNPIPVDWNVKPSRFEHTMTITAVIIEDAGSRVTDQWMVGAFVGDECRGYQQAIWIEALQQYYFFITTYSNRPGEVMRFKAFTGTEVIDLDESLYFDVNTQHGRVEAPFEFHLVSTSTSNDNELRPFLKLEPNPASTSSKVKVTFFTGLSEEVSIQVYDMQGKPVITEKMMALNADNAYWLDAQALPAGVYELSIAGQQWQHHKKLILIK